MKNNKLLVVDAASVLSFTMKRVESKNAGITKQNSIISGFSEFSLLIKNSQATHAVILFDRCALEHHYARLTIPKKQIEPQIEEFKNFVTASGANLIVLENGGIVDCITQLIGFSKKAGLEICIISDDIFLTRFIDEGVDFYLFKLRRIITKEMLRSIVGIEPSQVLDLVRLIGVDWFSFAFSSARMPVKNYLPNIGVATAVNLLKKYSNIPGVFKNIETISPKIAASLISQQENLTANDVSFLGQMYSQHDLSNYKNSIADIYELIIKSCDYQSLINIYKKFSLHMHVEKMQAEALKNEKNISLRAAMIQTRRESSQEEIVHFDVPEKYRSNPVTYRIKNAANGKMYFGSTRSLEKRAKEHINNLHVSLHHNPELNSDYKKFGRNEFSLKVLGTFDLLEDAKKREQLYIDLYYGRSCCYNYSPFADESAPWNVEKKIYTVCAEDILSKRYRNKKGSVLESGQGSWLSIHAAAKEMKMDKIVVRDCFQNACNAGGEASLDGWRYIVKNLPKKHIAT